MLLKDRLPKADSWQERQMRLKWDSSGTNAAEQVQQSPGFAAWSCSGTSICINEAEAEQNYWLSSSKDHNSFKASAAGMQTWSTADSSMVQERSLGELEDTLQRYSTSPQPAVSLVQVMTIP